MNPGPFARSLVIVGVALLAGSSAVEARRGEAPRSRSAAVSQNVDRYFIPPIELEALLAEEDAKVGGAFRFAEPIAVRITPATHGTTELLPDGGSLWRLEFDAPGATDLNFGFTRYDLPAGATLHVVSGTGDYYEGPYTHRDNEDHGEFWSPVVPGPRAVVELYVPARVKYEPVLEIGQVGYGYRDMFKLFEGPVGRQGSCNNDVVCPEGAPWADQIQSVAVYTLNGSWTCTGSMVNNVREDFTNYFLTAAHCGVGAGNASSIVVYWNYESPNCGDLCCGSLSDNQSGSVWRAGRGDVDFTLIELDDDPDPASEVFYTGWENDGVVPNGSVGIHHPSTDEKAISFNVDPLGTQNSCIGGGGTNTHWRVHNWEDGTTEPGSSGSGLWNPDTKRLVGFLSGGLAACGNTQYDCYGKFSVAWSGGSASSRLQDWLDPDGTGATSVEGLAQAPSLKYSSHIGTDECASDPSNDNGIWEPGEFVTVPVEIRASGGAFSSISGNLSTTTPGVTILDGSASWPNLASGASSVSNAPHFSVLLDETIECGAVISFEIVLTAAEGGPFNLAFTNEVGQALTPPGIPIPIPDNSAIGVTSTFDVPVNVSLTDLDVRVEINHTWVGDLKIDLESPSGTRIVLLDRPGVPASSFGCSDDNMNVTFDDASGFNLENHCSGSAPWYAGVAAPVAALAAFNGEGTQGKWKLIVSDNAGQDTGVIADWELITTPAIQGECESCVTTVSVGPSPAASGGFRLAQNRPNPFGPQTEISFTIDREAHTTLEIYDVAGRLVVPLLDRLMVAGTHSVSWDGLDASGRAVAAGIYFYRLGDGTRSEIKRMNLIR